MFQVLFSRGPAAFETIDGARAVALRESGAIVVDVRNPDEIARSGTVKGAVRAPLAGLSNFAKPDGSGKLPSTDTDKPIVLSGRVFDADGRPSPAFPIVVFSTDSTHWSAGSRRVQQVRPASDGSYRLLGLPAGEYFVGAVTTLDLEDLYDPVFLQQIVPIAFRITLAEGETKQQDLKLGGGGEGRR